MSLTVKHGFNNKSVENMLVTSIDIMLETGVVPTQYIVIILTAADSRIPTVGSWYPTLDRRWSYC